MPQITIQRDPSRLTNLERHNIDGQVNLLSWLNENMPEDNDGLHCSILLNGAEICNTWDFTREDCIKSCNIDIGEFDNAIIISRPQGIETATILAIIAVVSVAALVILKPKIPRVGAIDDATSGSSNNQLNSSGNSFRPNQAIADIAGQVVSYPDFIQPSYYQYQNGQRVFREIFCIGKGQYDVTEIREVDTLVSGLIGYEATVYPPLSTPPELLNVRTSQNSVDLDLLSADAQTRTVYLENEGEVGTTGADALLTLPSDLFDALEPNIGDSLTWIITYDPYSGDPDITTSGTADVIGIVGTTIELDFTFIQSGAIISGYITNNEFVFESPWFELEGDEVEEVWFNLVMPQGIRNGLGTDATVTATLEAQEIDEFGADVGSPISRGASFVGNTQSAQRQTFKLTSSDGITPARYKARATRITASLGDNASDLLTLEGISSVTPYTASFGDVTLLDVTRKSSQRVNRGSSTKINALVTRKLRIYDNDTGIYGATYVATRRFCDYAFYLLHELAGVAIADINTDELFGIHDNLSDEFLGYFDFTFDDKNTSLRERLITCCNAARVNPWNEGLLWSFVREEVKPVKQLMFNRRNLAAAASQYVQTFALPSSNDGVNLRFVNPAKNAEKTISKRIVAGAIVDGIGVNPINYHLLGCRDESQAVNRLNLEVRRLLYQNVVVKDTALNDAQLIRFGERCDWVDIYDSDMFDGEILSVSGNVYSTSERFTPVDGVTYYVYITDADGNPSNSVIATARSDGNIFGFEATGLTGVYLASGVVQSGSRYFIASNNDLDASTFTLVSRSSPDETGACQIELAEYNQLMFSED